MEEDGIDPYDAENAGAEEGDECRERGFAKTAQRARKGVHQAKAEKAGPFPEHTGEGRVPGDAG